MKISMDPMSRLREDAESKIDLHFNSLAVASAHRDAAHKAKREIAQSVMDQLSNPGLLGRLGFRNVAQIPDDHPFAQEAALRGLPVEEHARDIVAKPDNVQLRELRRQRLRALIKAAQTPAEIAGLIAAF